jgi:hypothetical protein
MSIAFSRFVRFPTLYGRFPDPPIHESANRLVRLQSVPLPPGHFLSQNEGSTPPPLLLRQ